MKIFISILILFVLNSCNLIPEEPIEPEQYYKKPTNSKEMALKDSLLKLGFDSVSYNIPIIGYGMVDYKIKIYCNDSVKKMSYGKLKQIGVSIADSLYTYIIPDSTLFVLNVIKIDFCSKSGFAFMYEFEKSTQSSYLDFMIKDLALKHGFIVKRTGKTTYKRTQVDSLTLDKHWKGAVNW